MHLFGMNAAITTTAVALHWITARKWSAFRVFPTRSTANGFAGVYCHRIRLLKRRLSVAVISSGARYAERHLSRNPTERNTVRSAPKMHIASRKPPENGKGGRAWTNRLSESLLYQGFPPPEHDYLKAISSPLWYIWTKKRLTCTSALLRLRRTAGYQQRIFSATVPSYPNGRMNFMLT